MIDISIIADFDVFFYNGSNDLLTEIESDLMAGIIQEKRSLFYNRRDSAGIRENYPNALALSVATRYDVANWVAFRNSRVGDGTNGTKDRRAAVSQNFINFQRDAKGNLDVEVLYVPYFDFKKAQQMAIPVPGGL